MTFQEVISGETHPSSSQRAMAAIKSLTPAERATRGTRKRLHDELAVRFDLSRMTLYRAHRVVDSDPDLTRMVEEGHMSVRAAELRLREEGFERASRPPDAEGMTLRQKQLATKQYERMHALVSTLSGYRSTIPTIKLDLVLSMATPADIAHWNYELERAARDLKTLRAEIRSMSQ